MERRIIEIKAHCHDQGRMRERLLAAGAEFRGTDRQVDTYFDVGTGRLKLRKGLIENALIYYERQDQRAPKKSDVILHQLPLESSLQKILAKALRVLVVVDKKREIYYIDNVKFHLDRVAELGEFVEIEAIDSDGSRSTESLSAQCRSCMEMLGIAEDDLVVGSYSDMLLCATMGAGVGESTPV